MTTPHLLMLASVALGAVAGSLVTWKISAKMWLGAGILATEKAHMEGFEKGCRVTADRLDEMHRAERLDLASKLATHSDKSLSRYGRTLLVMHYACVDGCEENHEGEIPAKQA